MKLEGKTALVTGAGRGIGQAIALKLAAEGANVICVSRSEANAQSCAQKVQALGRKASAFGIDVSQAEEVEKCVEQSLQDFGKIDILINNAGVTKDTLLVRMKDSDWDEVLAVNLKGAFLFSRALAKPMMKQRSGRIVNISSVVGVAGNAGQVNYAASKAGLLGMTKSIAKELGSRGITCNAVAPGFIETDMTAEMSEEMRRKVTENSALNRMGAPDDIANAVLFFCSDGAGFITGQVLCVDGGLSM